MIIDKIGGSGCLFAVLWPFKKSILGESLSLCGVPLCVCVCSVSWQCTAHTPRHVFIIYIL